MISVLSIMVAAVECVEKRVNHSALLFQCSFWSLHCVLSQLCL